MNREIEFRGKRLDNGEWLYGDLMHDNHGGCYIYPLDSLGLFAENKVANDTVGQFTRLKDKNGKEIYEDDVVRYNDTFDSDYVKYDEKQKVEFIDGCFYPISEEWCQDIKVIGNIHDNPELLSTK